MKKDKHDKEKEEKFIDEHKMIVDLAVNVNHESNLYQLNEDIERRNITNLKRMSNFRNNIDNHINEKVQKKQVEKEIYLNEKYDHFPFTHGENLEHKRKELQDKYKEVSQS